MDPHTTVDPERSSGADSQAWVKCSRCYRPFLKIGAMRCPCQAASATVVKPVGFATGNGEGSRRRIRTRIAL